MRIAFDLDGVLADLGTSYVEAARRLFPDLEVRAPSTSSSEDDETPFGLSADVSALALDSRQSEDVWKDIAGQPDFWESLPELEPGIIARLAAVADARRWEVLFITSRPLTAGGTVQRQTQRWLERHGFPLPSVYVVHGSRGRVADALALDVVVDDRPSNCLDVVLESRASAVLVWRGERARVPRRAARLGIAVAASVAVCLDTLQQADGRDQRLIDRVRHLFGLKTTSRGFGRAQE